MIAHAHWIVIFVSTLGKFLSKVANIQNVIENALSLLVANLPLELDQQPADKVSKLFRAISKKESLNLFLLAKDGIEAESSAPQKVGLSRKMYYTRLRQLVDAGLVSRYGNRYSHTVLGRIIYQEYVLSLFERIKDTKQLEMIEILKHAGRFSDYDIDNFVAKIMNAASSSVSRNGTISPPKIEIFWSYEASASKIARCVDLARSTIVFATRFYNETLINTILLKAKSRVDVRILADVGMVTHYLEMEKKGLQMLDKNAAERMNVVKDPWYPSSVNRRVTTVPFSMMLIDGKEAGVELVDSSSPQKFTGALYTNDEGICKQLMDFYDKLWLQASDNVPEKSSR